MIGTSTLAGGSLVISKGSDRPLKTCGEGGKAVPYQDFHSLSLGDSISRTQPARRGI